MDIKMTQTLEQKILSALSTIEQGNPLEIYQAIYQPGENLPGNFDSMTQKLGSMVKEGKINRPERGVYAIAINP